MKVIVEGLATEYEDSGNGSVWLFLHGWGDSLDTFDALIKELPVGNRYIRLDLPGFGKSETAQRPWYVTDYTRFVSEFLEKIDVLPEVIIGHSLGGRILLRGIADKVFTTKRAVFIASAGLAERATVRNMFFAAIAKMGRAILSIPPLTFFQAKAKRMLYNASGSDYMSAGTQQQTFLNIIRENLSDAARAVSIPSLIVWGRDDTTTPVSEGAQLHTYIEGSQFTVFDGAGHFVHQEKSKEVAQLIQEFCV